MPANYIEFLRKFSPMRVTVNSRRYYQCLRLYGATELIDGQLGYSVHGKTGEVLPVWPKAYAVIADHAANPLVLDLSEQPGDGAAVLTAMHGQGTWEFSRVAPSFLAFLQGLAR